MPITSVTQLSQEFAGLPEEGKRMAVSLMNKFEGQGLIGVGAEQQVLSIMRQLYNQGADGTWVPKNATAVGGQEKSAFIGGLMLPMMAGSFIADKIPGKTGKIVGKGLGMVGSAAALFSGAKETFDSFKENTNNINPTVNMGVQPMNNQLEVRGSVDFDRLMQKISFARNIILDAASHDYPLQLAKYEKGEKTASVVMGTTKDLFGMFPKIAQVIKEAAGIVPVTLERLMDKALPIAAASGIIIGGKEIYDGLRRHRAYSGMFSDYPELQDADQDRIKRLYRLIQNYSPGLAKDSLGAGALIKNMLNYPDVIDISTIQGLINMEKGLNESSMSSPFIRGMMTNAATNLVSPSDAEKLEDRLRLIHENPNLLLDAGAVAASRNVKNGII